MASLASSLRALRTVRPRFATVVTRPRNFSCAARRLLPSVKVVGDHGLESARDMFELKDKNFVVTGGGRGIGYAVTRAIAEFGGNVVVMDQSDCPVKDFETLTNEFDVKLEYIQADVTDEKSLSGAFEQAVSTLGGIDGCVTNAGIVLDKPFLEHTWEEATKIQNVNVLGTLFSAQLAAKQMKKQDVGGSIVMLASVCAHCAVPGHQLSAYHASKGAVLMLSRALAVELAPMKIRVNTISPGYIESPMTEALRAQRPHMAKVMNEAPPLKRIGTRNDLVGAMVYLLSDASKYTTGADIAITGGLHAGRIEV